MNIKKIIILVLAALLSAGSTARAQIEIRTASDMAAIGKDGASRKGAYILMNDLTLENWTPVGFNGTFNGNGHTITLAINSVTKDGRLKASANPASAGLFDGIGNSGVVMNLHVAGSIHCESNHYILSAGGIAGFNSGKIANCISSVNLDAKGVDQRGGMEVQVTVGGASGGYGIRPFDDGVMVGGIAGINSGKITNSYATGEIRVSGNGDKIGGGIAGGNGEAFMLVDGFTSPDGLGSRMKASITNCYATGVINIQDDGRGRVAGGIAGRNVTTLANCVALNSRINVSGKNQDARPDAANINTANALLGENYSIVLNKGAHKGSSQNSYYRADMIINMEAAGATGGAVREKPDGAAVDPESAQRQGWWENSPKFAFGQTSEAPWIWDETLQRPVLYWEKSKVAPMPATQGKNKSGADAGETSGKVSADIDWRVENNTLIVTGKGDIPGIPAWAGAIKECTAAEIGDGITSVGHHAFAMSKIKSLVLGKDVASLNMYALFRCKDLATVEVRNPVPPKIGAFAFMLTPVGKAKLIVPAGSKAVYSKNKDWKKFGEIEER